jgi:hypothetical protein
VLQAELDLIVHGWTSYSRLAWAIHGWIWDSKAGFSIPWQDLLLQGMIWVSMAGFTAPRHDLAVHQPICMVFAHFGGLNGGYDMIQHSRPYWHFTVQTALASGYYITIDKCFRI